jgi:general secretion pathway protein C
MINKLTLPLNSKVFSQTTLYLIVITIVTIAIVINMGLNISPLWQQGRQEETEVNTSPVIVKPHQTDRLQKLILFQDSPTISSLFKQGKISLDDPRLSNAPITTLKLRLKGVISSSDKNGGMAIIEENKRQNSYVIDDVLANTSATIVRTFPDRIIIKNNNKYESILLD